MSQDGVTGTSAGTGAERLTALRQLAQEHLQEIGEQVDKERLEEQEVQSVLQEEAMRRNKPKAVQPAADIPLEKGGKMRTAQDVLDRIRWDPSYDVKAYVIGYLDRFGGIKEIHAPIWLDDSTDEDWVPQHRIRYFKKLLPGTGEEIVWHRFDRIDKVFGSAAPSA